MGPLGFEARWSNQRTRGTLGACDSLHSTAAIGAKVVAPSDRSFGSGRNGKVGLKFCWLTTSPTFGEAWKCQGEGKHDISFFLTLFCFGSNVGGPKSFISARFSLFWFWFYNVSRGPIITHTENCTAPIIFKEKCFQVNIFKVITRHRKIWKKFKKYF
jgi:hypothetical protein